MANLKMQLTPTQGTDINLLVFTNQEFVSDMQQCYEEIRCINSLRNVQMTHFSLQYGSKQTYYK